jgi:pimeloyl-ACP methyl ester carboxylesterase
MTSADDLVVVLPGILGSTLRRDGKLVWAPSAGSVLRAIGTLGGSVERLKLPIGIGDEFPYDGVEPGELMPDLHVLPGIWTAVKGYDRLLARLRTLGYRDGANLIPVPYDWRLSCRYNARRLGEIVEPALERWRHDGHDGARVVFVCHSMGGLIARWYIEKRGGAEITAKLITLGTPYRGAAKALAQLVNGADPGVGRFRLQLTELARSMPSLHQLMPEYACLQAGDGLAKTTDVGITLPELDPGMVADAMRFHTDLREAEAGRPASLEDTYPILGTRQTTATTARLTDCRIELIDTYGREGNLFGDATVPIVAACRADVKMDSNTLRRVPDKHGNLQRNRAALDEVEGILTASSVVVKAAKPVELRVDVPELVRAGEAITVRVTPAEPVRQAMRLTVTSEQGALVEARVLRPSAGPVTASIDGLAPGAYSVDVGGTDEASPFAAVSSDVLVWADPGEG